MTTLEALPKKASLCEQHEVGLLGAAGGRPLATRVIGGARPEAVSCRPSPWVQRDAVGPHRNRHGATTADRSAAALTRSYRGTLLPTKLAYQVFLLGGDGY
jgi:hypothetical protein